MQPLIIKILGVALLILPISCGKRNEENISAVKSGHIEPPKSTATEAIETIPAPKISQPPPHPLETLPPDLLKMRDASIKIRTLAKTNLTSAIAECNKLMSSELNSDENTLQLHHVLANALYAGLFGERCLFDQKQTEILKSVVLSDLVDPVKAKLLVQSSAGTQGNAEASDKVLKIALEFSNDPSALASIVSDIAQTKPDVAIASLSSVPWRAEYGKATSRLYATYIMEQPEKGSIAVNQIPKNSAMYQWAAAGLIQAVRNVDTEATAHWRSEITDPEALEFADSLTYDMKISR